MDSGAIAEQKFERVSPAAVEDCEWLDMVVTVAYSNLEEFSIPKNGIGVGMRHCLYHLGAVPDSVEDEP